MLRRIVREEVRAIVREELAAAAPPKTAPAPAAALLYLTPREAAQIANVSGKTLRRWVQDGKLPARSLGRLIRIARADLVDFMERGGATSKNTETADEIATRVMRRARR